MIPTHTAPGELTTEELRERLRAKCDAYDLHWQRNFEKDLFIAAYYNDEGRIELRGSYGSEHAALKALLELVEGKRE